MDDADVANFKKHRDHRGNRYFKMTLPATEEVKRFLEYYDKNFHDEKPVKDTHKEEWGGINLAEFGDPIVEDTSNELVVKEVNNVAVCSYPPKTILFKAQDAPPVDKITWIEGSYRAPHGIFISCRDSTHLRRNTKFMKTALPNTIIDAKIFTKCIIGIGKDENTGVDGYVYYIGE